MIATLPGRPHFPCARGLRWGEVLLFANRLSELVGLEPAYALPDGYARGMIRPEVWDPYADRDRVQRLLEATRINLRASGYRLPSEAELIHALLAGRDIEKQRYSLDLSQHPNAWGVRTTGYCTEEWVQDRHAPYPSPDSTPSLDTSRGGLAEVAIDPTGPNHGPRRTALSNGNRSGGRFAKRYSVLPYDERPHRQFRLVRRFEP